MPTALYFTMLPLSVITEIAAVSTARQLSLALVPGMRRCLAYIAAVTVAMLILPPVNEVPADLSATTLWNLRLASFAVDAVLRAALGLIFGVLVDRSG